MLVQRLHCQRLHSVATTQLHALGLYIPPGHLAPVICPPPPVSLICDFKESCLCLYMIRLLILKHGIPICTSTFFIRNEHNLVTKVSLCKCISINAKVNKNSAILKSKASQYTDVRQFIKRISEHFGAQKTASDDIKGCIVVEVLLLIMAFCRVTSGANT